MDYAVIMAGGSGTRLWPLSRKDRPKQIIDIFGGETLLRKAFERLLPVFEPKKILVQTNDAHTKKVKKILPEVPKKNIIGEPYMRNTAGAVGLAASFIADRDSDASMTVVTADHIIEPQDKFTQTLSEAVQFVNDNPENLITFGITPTYPSTQYGYIRLGKKTPYDGSEVYKVESFQEKPDAAKAEDYLESGNYLWNSGMFVWKAQAILSSLYHYLPDCKKPLKKIQKKIGSKRQDEVIEERFKEVPKISIDYAVMEKSPSVYSIKLDCDWLDMGSYNALTDLINQDSDNNALAGNTPELIDCSNNIIINQDDNHTIAGIGVENMVVAHTEDVTFICPREKCGDIKEMIEQVRKNKGEKLL
ncbi:Mannose-1-phosphate guanylyltransferase RfbM [Sedimentisphaera cyanobacteriorum]|uniref:mannose-1-phosphate guanylyltransferase n=1 Tax=Sedimentisphaera cyanobacteriorum TaxID=1940790 RepID=A0A1Q2HM59_9BACT|nr:mannose-1-phosphate guanylyltransferase [Sedimentisphaera cyanobacteriorum]AQQ08323.1 Mannose-1-phosphate guanylyltransferase RfbM [Sedimentisphaera cyanobacteriorum]